ncbi:MAG: hypothetical protein ACYTFQ_14845, partial [Planctomycetota bacterium]
METKGAPKKNPAMVLVSIAVAAAIVCGVPACRDKPSQDAEPASTSSSIQPGAATTETASAQVSMQKLVGRWLRTDSPYVIEIREVAPDGTLRAGYFNPRPINVSAAKVENKGGTLEVFVELHDAGYPGSNYTLSYNRKTDALEGTYFQAT